MEFPAWDGHATIQDSKGTRLISRWLSPARGILSIVSPSNCKYSWLPHICFFTDEATFTREGILNSHNSHVWDFVNPKATRVFRQQHNLPLMCGLVLFTTIWLGHIFCLTDSMEENKNYLYSWHITGNVGECPTENQATIMVPAWRGPSTLCPWCQRIPEQCFPQSLNWSGWSSTVVTTFSRSHSYGFFSRERWSVWCTSHR